MVTLVGAGPSCCASCGALVGAVQVGGYRQLEEVGPEEAGGEEEHLEAFHVARLGVEARDDVVAQLLGLLLGIGGATRDVEDVRLPVVLKINTRRQYSSTSSIIMSSHASRGGSVASPGVSRTSWRAWKAAIWRPSRWAVWV